MSNEALTMKTKHYKLKWCLKWNNDRYKKQNRYSGKIVIWEFFRFKI